MWRLLFKDYKPLDFPKGCGVGVIFSTANSRQLDIYGAWKKLERRRLWIFKEPDNLFKIRIRNVAIEELNDKLKERV